MAIIPLGKKLYIIPLEDPKKRGYVYLPETAQQRIDQGIVLYKGPLVKDVMVGDHVFFAGYAGTRITIEGEGTLIILDEGDIDAVVTDKPSDVFSREQINNFLARVPNDLVRRGISDSAANYVFELLNSYFNDYLFSEGLRF